jgi:hypothetical protein
VQSKNFVISCKSDGTREVFKMTSRKTKYLLAAVGALIATVAVARTVHTHVAAPSVHVSSGKVTGATPSQTTPPHRHGAIVCGMAFDSDCEKLETLLPM